MTEKHHWQEKILQPAHSVPGFVGRVFARTVGLEKAADMHQLFKKSKGTEKIKGKFCQGAYGLLQLTLPVTTELLLYGIDRSLRPGYEVKSSFTDFKELGLDILFPYLLLTTGAIEVGTKIYGFANGDPWIFPLINGLANTAFEGIKTARRKRDL